MKNHLILSIFLFCGFVGFSQQVLQYQPPWPYLYDNGPSDVFKASYNVLGTSDYYAVGTSHATGNKDIVLAFMTNAVPNWTQLYGGATDDYANTVAFTSNMGGMLIIGGKSYNGTDFDALAFDVDMAGAIMGASYTYNYDSGDEEFLDFIPDASVNIVGIGYATHALLGKQCLAVLMGTGSSGIEEFNTYVFGGAGEDVLTSGINNSSNYYVTGYTTSMGAGGKDAYFAQIDPISSYTIMDTTWGGANDDVINDLYFNNYSYNLLGVGYTESFGSGGKDIYVVKLSMSLDTMWTRTIGGLGDEEAFTIVPDGDFSMGSGFYVISGYTTSYGTLDTNMYQIKINDLGDLLWHGYVDETGTEIAYTSMIKECDIPTIGQSNSSGTEDGLIFSTPRVNIEISGTDVTCNGMADGTGSVIVTGGSYKLMYVWLDEDSNPIIWDNPNITGLSGGTYYVSIDDMELFSCLFKDSIFVFEPEVLSGSVTSTDVTCMGTADGFAVYNVVGGVSPYSYLWSTGGTDPFADNLVEDILTSVTATDFNGCQINNEFMIIKQALASVFGTILPYTGGDITDEMATGELFKLNGIGDAELVTSIPVYSMGFDFTDMEPANYIIRIAMDPSLTNDLMHTYYGDVHSWEFATILEAGCDSIFESLVIQMAECEVEFSGQGVFSGSVRIVSSGAKDIGEPVPGAEIYLEQEPEGEPIAVTESDVNGDYDFNGLPTNVTYSLSVDIPGFPLIQTYSNIVVTDTDTVFEDLDFYVDTTNGDQGVYIEDPFISVPTVLIGSTEISVFPNPSTEKFNINYTLNEKADVRIMVLDGNGKILSSLLNQNQETGDYELEIGNNILTTKGLYFLQIQVNNKVYLKKLILQ